jgi:hypothetical protein
VTSKVPLGLAWIALAAAGCARVHSTVPADPGVSFAAHREGEDLVIDRMPEGGAAVVAPAGRLRLPDSANLRLRVDGQIRAAFWTVGQSRVLLRDGPSTLDTRAGEVLSTWDGTAIRLVLFTREGKTFRTDVFARVGAGERSPPPLSRDVRGGGGAPSGTFRADIRDDGGAPVGWMRAQIAPGDDAPRIYDAVLPPTVDGALAAAATIALDEEIVWIEGHGATAP